MLEYRRFAGAPRMLVLETGYFFDASWRRAARQLGWESAAVASAMVGGLTRDQVRQFFATLCSFRPDFVLACNYSGMDDAGLLARFLEDARIPYVTHFTDAPRMILFDRVVHANPYAVAATWERAYLPYLHQIGFAHTLHWPLATDPALFNGTPCHKTVRDVAFVGRSMALQAEEVWAKLAPYPEIVRKIEEILDRGVSKETFAHGIETLLETVGIGPGANAARRHIENAINYEHTRRQRAALIAALAPLHVCVHGDAGWNGIDATVGGPIGYFDDLASFYRETAVNVNLTALQMPSALNQRVFDCPAAGGFLLTDAQPDLEELFEPQEVAVYASFDEAHDKAAYFLQNPEKRVQITIRAQARIAARHTYAHRLSSLNAYLRDRFQT